MPHPSSTTSRPSRAGKELQLGLGHVPDAPRDLVAGPVAAAPFDPLVGVGIPAASVRGDVVPGRVFPGGSFLGHALTIRATRATQLGGCREQVGEVGEVGEVGAGSYAWCMTCAVCGRPLPDDARFCPGCGAAVTSSLGTDERKIVTVLFADLVDSTGLAQRLDAERARDVLGRFYDAATQELLNPSRPAREVHRRRRDGGLRPAAGARGRRAAGGARRARRSATGRIACTRSSASPTPSRCAWASSRARPRPAPARPSSSS